MKLLFFIDRFVPSGGGLEDQARRLCTALAAAGHNITVIANESQPAEGITVINGLHQAGEFRKTYTPDLTIDWGLLHAADLHRLGQGTHRQSFPLILDGYRGLARLIKRLRFLGPGQQSKINQQIRLLRRPQAHFLANSHQTLNMAVADGANPDKITVHHQTVDLNHFSPARLQPQRIPTRKGFQIPEHEVVFGFVAHNLRMKNLDLLLKIFSRLSQSLPIRLLVASRKAPNFRAPWLTYAGHISDIAAIYSACDALLHPTFFDSCANVVLEAMASGVPVAVSNTSGIHEIISHQLDGYVLPVRGNHNDIVALWSETIRKLASDIQLRQTIASEGRKRAEQQDYSRFLPWFEEFLMGVEKTRRTGVRK
jgi:UDP-glucose:(heptosyl)LPS alpha-1,3-glucosyltransferase